MYVIGFIRFIRSSCMNNKFVPKIMENRFLDLVCKLMGSWAHELMSTGQVAQRFVFLLLFY